MNGIRELGGVVGKTASEIALRGGDCISSTPRGVTLTNECTSSATLGGRSLVAAAQSECTVECRLFSLNGAGSAGIIAHGLIKPRKVARGTDLSWTACYFIYVER
jgi:hypothetical protein